MTTEQNVRTVQDFFAAIGRGDTAGLLALIAEDIAWIIPGRDWPLAGTHRGHAAVAEALEKAAREVPFSYPAPLDYVAQGDRIMVAGFATGTITATNRPFEDHFVFAITMRDGKLATIREYIDTQALARAAQVDGAAPASPSTPARGARLPAATEIPNV